MSGNTHRRFPFIALLLTINEEELQEVKDDQKRIESIEVDVERVAPLHVKVFAGVFQQVLVADEPETENTKPHVTSQKSQLDF